jgi:hypothetical protein
MKTRDHLEAAIHDYLAKHDTAPKPFVWTKKADVILAKNARARAALEDVRNREPSVGFGTLKFSSAERATTVRHMTLETLESLSDDAASKRRKIGTGRIP